MAYHKPQNIDDFVQLMSKSDMRVKAQLAEDLVEYLSDMENSIASNDLGLLVQNLMPCIIDRHFKMVAVDAFIELIGRLGQDFAAYTPTILPQVILRLGDSRKNVREKAQLLLCKLMENRVLLPQQLLYKLSHCFKHKNSQIREELLQTIVTTLNDYGTESFCLKAYIQPIVSLLRDPTSTVRDAAIHTLVEIYKHFGDKLRIDLRKENIHQTTMAKLEREFDEARQDGLLLPSALRNIIEPDDTDASAAAEPTISKPATPSSTKFTLDTGRSESFVEIPGSASERKFTIHRVNGRTCTVYGNTYDNIASKAKIIFGEDTMPSLHELTNGVEIYRPDIGRYDDQTEFLAIFAGEKPKMDSFEIWKNYGRE